MLNRELSRVNSYANKNSILVDTSWNTYENKSVVGKIISFTKQEADTVLNEEQVKEGYYYSCNKGLKKLPDDLGGNNNFSYISEKDNIINKNIGDIMSIIETAGFIPYEYLLKELLISYVNQGLIKKEDLKKGILKYLEKEFNNYKNKIGFDTFNSEEKSIIAFGLYNDFVDDFDYYSLDNLKFYYFDSYKYNLVDIYLKKLLLDIK